MGEGNDSAVSPSAWPERIRRARSAGHAAFERARLVPAWLERTSRVWFAILFGAALIVALVPIWSVAWLPLGDLGGWVDLMDVMARYGDPATIYSQVYLPPTGFEPNSLAVYVGGWLGPLVPADVAGKILVSWYVVGIPLGMLAVCRAFERSPWLSFFAFPMAYTGVFNVGLLNYLIGMPLIFLGVALARTYALRGGVVRGILLAACLIVLWYAHVLAVLIGWASVVAVIALSMPSWKRSGRIWPALPVIPLFVHWYHRMFVDLAPTERGLTLGTKQGFEFEYATLDAKFESLHAWGMRFFRDEVDEKCLCALLVSWFALAAFAFWPRKKGVVDNAVVRGKRTNAGRGHYYGGFGG